MIISVALIAASMLPIHAAPAVEPAVEAFPLSSVRLLDSPFKQNMDRCTGYLLRLEPDRLLAGFRREAGLEPKGELYGGWEMRGVAGHSLGHYLSAISLAYAATGDAQFKERAEYIVAELGVCQDAQGDGYLSAIPEGRPALEKLRSGEVAAEPFELNGIWVPWYTQHKILAGLLDAHAYTGSARALEIAEAFARYVDSLTSGLSEEQWQIMLACEHGGMNESFAELYARTGDERFLALSRKFHHRAVLDPLAERERRLEGLHANTQIPKVIGVARRHELTGGGEDRAIADFFWKRVVRHHSYANGCHSMNEHFGPPDQLAERLEPATMETCNSYNMLKLTRHLFTWDAAPEKAAFYERALYNHILASQDPEEGMTCYYVPLGPGLHKTYSTPFDSFWCCTGTGMENHVRYGEAIYFHTDDALYVNLFIPSRLTWASRGVTLLQETAFPASHAVTFTLEEADEGDFAIKLRVPEWTAGPVDVAVNGEAIEATHISDGYLPIRRSWKQGDRITLNLPMALRTEAMPDDPKRVAVLYGPVVLAADLGPAAGDLYGTPAPAQPADNHASVPVVLAAGRDVSDWVEPVPGEVLTFRAHRMPQAAPLTLKPFYLIHHRAANVFWDLLTESEWQDREQARREAARQEAELDARTLDRVLIGNDDSEGAHKLQGEHTQAGPFRDRHWRHATGGGWFGYELSPGPAEDIELLVTYWGSDAGQRVFDIEVNGKSIATETINHPAPGQFVNRIYPVPSEILNAGEPLTVRFKAKPGHTAGGVFDLRVLRAQSSDKSGPIDASP